jgi:hypothetical protein
MSEKTSVEAFTFHASPLLSKLFVVMNAAGFERLFLVFVGYIFEI